MGLTFYRLPPINNAALFEAMCLAIWQRDAGRTYKALGRQGQEQHGIDLFGDAAGKAWIGIQCKVRDHFLRTSVTEKHVDEWIARAGKGVKTSKQPLAKLILVTTAPRDEAIQRHVKVRSEQKAHGFSVDYYSWDDLEKRLFADDSREVLRRFYPQFGFHEQRRTEVATYLASRREGLQVMPLDVLGAETPAEKVRNLSDVFTMLEVQALVSPSGPREPGASQPRPGELESPPWTLPYDPNEVGDLVGGLAEQGEAAAPAKPGQQLDRTGSSRPATVLEAISVNPRLILTGDGGSGKSTVARYLALCLTDAFVHDANGQGQPGIEQLTRRRPRLWRHGMLAPLYIDLPSFARSAWLPTEQNASAESLWSYIAASSPHHDAARLRANLTGMMDDHGSLPGLMLILDSLDEIPDRQRKTPVLLTVLARFLAAHPACRVLLTSRRYAVLESETAAALTGTDGLRFAEVTLAPPSDAFLGEFLTAFFSKHPEKAEQILTGMRPELLSLITTPLMLTLVALMYAKEHRRWNNEADVLESATRQFIDHWNRGREVHGAALLHPHVERVRDALAELAFQQHVKSASAHDKRAGKELRFDESALRQVLEKHLRQPFVDLIEKSHVDARSGMLSEDEAKLLRQLQTRLFQDWGDAEIARYLRDRCGILAFADGTYRFSHLRLGEFLAAWHAQSRPDAPLPLLDAALSNPQKLEDLAEVICLAGALGARGQQVSVFTLLDYLLPSSSAEAAGEKDPSFARVHLAARIVEANGLWSPAREQDRAKIGRLRLWARQCAIVGALAPERRALVGRVLGMLGDDRKGVGLSADGLPDFDWVQIVPPKGMAYCIARYPVTNAQFEAFVQDGGYTAKWDACWTKAGLAWRQSHPKPRELSHPFSLPNHPRVEVTLHEAVAFANWLGARRKSKKGAIRLPTSSEWQFAAQSATKRSWAWGDDYGDGTRSNGSDAGIGSTCAVGIFPQGATPELGLHDMSGNVWNWAVRAEDPRAETTGSARGGSWLNVADYLRADFGLVNDAVYRYVHLGFRLAAPAST